MLTEVWMQRAFLAAVFLAPLCGLLGVFVTARRMAFFSDTISHAGLAGVALGVWLGMVDPTVPLIAVSLAVAAAIFWLKENTSLVTDSIMALLLSGSVAAGIVILKKLKTRPGDLHGFLFGDILAVGWPDVWQAAAMFLIIGAGFFWRLSDLSLLTAHEEIARVCGVRVRRLNYVFVIVLTLTVALTIRLLGIILVTALLVIPPAAASNLSRNLRQQIVLSVVAGLLGGMGGIVLAWHLNVPCGAAIVLASLGLFVVTLVAGRLRDASFNRPAPARST
ncbi:MAG TPA: metal ABC transporter permease [Verrucomicrobiae bacterium]|nr:metal ABC transporter permease [Verrucomicrobiae bacterium]